MAPDAGLVEAMGPEPDTDPLARLLNEIDAVAGVRVGLGLTSVYQTPFDRGGDADDLLSFSYDLSGEWTLVNGSGPDRGNAGVLGWLLEGGRPIGRDRDSDLSADLGSALGINDDLDLESFENTELWWAQTLFDGRLVLTLGKIDQSAYLDANAVANDETTQFLATPLVNNIGIPFPDNGLGLNMFVDLGEGFSARFAFGDGDAVATQAGFSTFGERGNFFYASELGWSGRWSERFADQALFRGWGEGNVRVLGWVNETDNGDGLGIAGSVDQDLGHGVTPWFRFGIGDEDVVDFDLTLSGGVGLADPFGRPGDFVGFGGAWARPSDDAAREESLYEVFYRARLSDHLELTPALQVVANPADDPDEDVEFVFALRLQVTY
ncbi:MAG: carbohydrate porin [Planctomycetota bacterium]